MPTAAKFIGALLYAALAVYVSVLVIPQLPEGTAIGYFHYIAGAAGLFGGWVVAGSRAGTGYVRAFSYGLTAMAATVFWALVIYSMSEMVERSLRKMYPTPTRALEGVFGLFAEYGAMLLTGEILFVLIVGGMAAGLIVEFISRRWN